VTTWQRIAADKRRVLIPLAIAAVANLALWLFVVYPLETRARTAESRAQAARTNLAQATVEYRAAEALRTGRVRADQQLTRFYNEVLPHDQAGARRITYLRLARLADQANLRHERRSFSPEVDEDSALARLDMTITLNGQYRDVRRFIHSLETSPEFIVIEGVSLTQAERDEPLSLALKLATYYRPSP
jgi:type IV pilus assembly protein PilO